jgi:hypothetical protein
LPSADEVANLWPEAYGSQPWNADNKDKQETMTKNIAIALLSALTIFLAQTLVTVENQRYAYEQGRCRDTRLSETILLWDNQCLATIETRTAWWRHLYDAVKD